MKLTLLSKILLSIIAISILITITICSLSIFKLNDNQCLLNIKTGQITTKQGIYFKNYFSHKKFDNPSKILEGQTAIQGKSGKIKAFLFILKYDYDLNWIEKNKKIPNTLYFLDYDFDNYMLNSTKILDDGDLLDRNHLTNILKFFYEKALNNTGYKIIKIYICSPIMPIDSPLNLYKNR